MSSEKNNFKLIEDIMGGISAEQFSGFVKAATKATSAAEVVAIAKEFGADITIEQAEQMIKLYTDEDVIPDEYLDLASGGSRSESSSSSSGCF